MVSSVWGVIVTTMLSNSSLTGVAVEGSRYMARSSARPPVVMSAGSFPASRGVVDLSTVIWICWEIKNPRFSGAEGLLQFHLACLG